MAVDASLPPAADQAVLKSAPGPASWRKTNIAAVAVTTSSPLQHHNAARVPSIKPAGMRPALGSPGAAATATRPASSLATRMGPPPRPASMGASAAFSVAITQPTTSLSSRTAMRTRPASLAPATAVEVARPVSLAPVISAGFRPNPSAATRPAVMSRPAASTDVPVAAAARCATAVASTSWRPVAAPLCRQLQQPLPEQQLPPLYSRRSGPRTAADTPLALLAQGSGEPIPQASQADRPMPLPLVAQHSLPYASAAAPAGVAQSPVCHAYEPQGCDLPVPPLQPSSSPVQAAGCRDGIEPDGGGSEEQQRDLRPASPPPHQRQRLCGVGSTYTISQQPPLVQLVQATALSADVLGRPQASAVGARVGSIATHNRQRRHSAAQAYLAAVAAASATPMVEINLRRRRATGDGSNVCATGASTGVQLWLPLLPAAEAPDGTTCRGTHSAMSGSVTTPEASRPAADTSPPARDGGSACLPVASPPATALDHDGDHDGDGDEKLTGSCKSARTLDRGEQQLELSSASTEPQNPRALHSPFANAMRSNMAFDTVCSPDSAQPHSTWFAQQRTLRAGIEPVASENTCSPEAAAAQAARLYVPLTAADAASVAVRAPRYGAGSPSRSPSPAVDDEEAARNAVTPSTPWRVIERGEEDVVESSRSAGSRRAQSGGSFAGGEGGPERTPPRGRSMTVSADEEDAASASADPEAEAIGDDWPDMPLRAAPIGDSPVLNTRRGFRSSGSAYPEPSDLPREQTVSWEGVVALPSPTQSSRGDGDDLGGLGSQSSAAACDGADWGPPQRRISGALAAAVASAEGPQLCLLRSPSERIRGATLPYKYSGGLFRAGTFTGALRNSWGNAAASSRGGSGRSSFAGGLTAVLARSLNLGSGAVSSGAPTSTGSRNKALKWGTWSQVYDVPPGMLYDRFSDRHAVVSRAVNSDMSLVGGPRRTGSMPVSNSPDGRAAGNRQRTGGSSGVGSSLDQGRAAWNEDKTAGAASVSQPVFAGGASSLGASVVSGGRPATQAHGRAVPGAGASPRLGKSAGGAGRRDSQDV